MHPTCEYHISFSDSSCTFIDLVTVKNPNPVGWVGYVLWVCGFLIASPLAAQVGIGTTAPSPSAVLELRSTSRGFLPPRLTTTQMASIPSPESGLMVYNTDSDQFYFYKSSAWQPLAGNENCWTRGGNLVTNPATEWVGTSNAQPVVFRTNGTQRMCLAANGNVGINGPATVGAPAATLELGGDLALRINPVPIPNGTNLTVDPGGYSILTCTPGADLVIQNITPGADGKVLMILHPNVNNSTSFGFVTTGNISTNTNNSVSATANNTPASATLVYSQALGKWMLVSFRD